MKFENGRQINKNLATNLPSPPHTRAAVVTTNITPICTPKKGATKDTGYVTPIGATRDVQRLDCIQKGNEERTSFSGVRSKSAIALPSETRITPAQPDKPPPIVTLSFIDSIVKGPMITHEMQCVAIATYFLEAMDAPPPNEDSDTTK